MKGVDEIKANDNTKVLFDSQGNFFVKLLK